MRKLRYIFLPIALALLFVSCWKEADNGGDDVVIPRQTLLFCMLGENNGLESNMNNNITDMLTGVTHSFPDKAEIFVFIEGASSTTLSRVVRPTQGKKATLAELKVYDHASFSGVDPVQLKGVLQDVLDHEDSPADTYGIILSSHAAGWLPKQFSLSYPRIIGSDGSVPPQSIKEEHGFEMDPEGEMTKWFGQEITGSYNRFMDISELVDVLSVIDFDYILFDACFMASVEALYDLRNSADYIIASPAEVMAKGFPMHKIVPALLDYRSTVKDRVVKASSLFYDYYNSGEAYDGSYKSASVAAVDCSKLEALAQSVKTIYNNGFREDVEAAWVQSLENLMAHIFFDLKDYVRAGYKYSGQFYNFEQALAQAVPYAASTPTIYSNAGRTGFFDANYMCGLSTYIPRPTLYPATAAEWYKTAWAQAIGAAPANP